VLLKGLVQLNYAMTSSAGPVFVFIFICAAGQIVRGHAGGGLVTACAAACEGTGKLCRMPCGAVETDPGMHRGARTMLPVLRALRARAA
jgi:hypothetical protein